MFKGAVDCVLVPLGLVVMGAYHAWLIRQVVRRPNTTVIAINRRLWIRHMMEDTSKNGVLAVQTLRNQMMASTVLASTAIMLGSVIAVFMSGSGGGGGGGGGHGIRPIMLIYGDRSELGFSIKFLAILVCFLASFLFNVQSIRYYSDASLLINVPNINQKKKMIGSSNLDDDDDHLINFKDGVTPEYVVGMVNRGSYFWSLGLHSFYFSFPLFLWIFGPIPMFMSCIVLVFLLYFLDFTIDQNRVSTAPKEMDHGEEV